MGRTGKMIVLVACGALLLGAVGASLVMLRDVDVPSARELDVLGVVCNDPRDFVPDGSCADPFLASDFAAGRATMHLTLITNPDGTRVVRYGVRNETDRLRSFDAHALELRGSTGARRCWTDAEDYRVLARPHEWRWNDCGDVLPGTYVATYDGAEVARLDVPPVAVA